MLALGIAVLLFLSSQRQMVLAGHDATVRPTLSGKVVLHTGPVLPDVRLDSPAPVGMDVVLGKTELKSLDELFQRYALLAASPEGQRAQVQSAVESMAVGALVRGAALAMVAVVGGVLLWRLPGPARRAELWRRLRAAGGTRREVEVIALATVTVMAVVVALWQPWAGEPRLQSDEASGPVAGEWESLSAVLGPDVHVPRELRGVEVRGDAYTSQTRKLIDSGMTTYNGSKVFYSSAARRASRLALRQPSSGETTAVIVADRHDNIGMDAVVRAVAHRAGATAVLDAGDDTSTGAVWERFSLDSLTAATDGLDRWAVTGNHDHGSTVGSYLDKHGWRMLDYKVTTGPGHSTMIGAPDPRVSGLGGDPGEKQLTAVQVGHRVADTACRSMREGRPVSTLLIHDPYAGREALRRGCVTLVIAGHWHIHVGPTQVVGSNGHVGWNYTTGTTGGAGNISFAMGRLAREAEISLVTYRGGTPVGLQWVDLEPRGNYKVHAYVPLQPPTASSASPGASPSGSPSKSPSASSSKSPPRSPSRP